MATVFIESQAMKQITKTFGNILLNMLLKIYICKYGTYFLHTSSATFEYIYNLFALNVRCKV